MEVKAAPEGQPTIAINVTFLSVAWVAVTLRMYTRACIIKKLYADDWLLLVSLANFTVYCSFVILLARSTEFGEGAHLSFGNIIDASKYGFLAETFYVINLCFLKVSLGLFFLRLAFERWKRVIIHALLVVIVTFSIVSILYNVFHCGSFNNWIVFFFRKLEEKCAPDAATLAVTFTHGAIMTITDWTFALMPFLVLRGSIMSRREKLAVGSLMAFASISGIASLVRFKYLSSIVVPTRDVFVETVNLANWSCIESGVGIIAASIICLRPLLRQHIAPFASYLYHMSGSRSMRSKSTAGSERLPDADDHLHPMPVKFVETENLKWPPPTIAARPKHLDIEMGRKGS